ncbi:MAG: DNA primase [Anaerolineae bacterium]|nr:DNA primase [Anaerolineae bacterium]
MSVADEIKARLDIVDYIGRFAPLKRAGRTWKACCPFHAEKTPSFVVNPDRQSWRCFGQCGVGGDVISFAMKQHNWTFAEALAELGKLVGVEVRQRTPEQRAADDRYDRLRGLMTAAAEAFHRALLNPDDPTAVKALAYAREKRGFTDETILKFMIGYAPPGWSHLLEHLREVGYDEADVIETGMAIRNENGRVYDRFRERLLIPIRDERGRVIGFGARALNPEDNPKYLNSPQTVLFDKSKTLFGLDTAKRAITESETVVIVEGYMDAIQAQQAGFGNVVAQMGTAMTEAQLKLIAPRYAKRIILALDSDAAGQSATLRGLEVARQTLQADYTGRLAVDIRILQIPGAKDPDDLIRENPARWSELIANAQPVAEYVIDSELRALPPDSGTQDVERMARRLMPMLVATDNSMDQRQNVQLLATRLIRLKQSDPRFRSLPSITEAQLFAWADEQRKINHAVPPTPDSTLASGEGPGVRANGGHGGEALAQLAAATLEDLPPEAYGDDEFDPASVLPAGESFPVVTVPLQAAPAPRRVSEAVAEAERHCLRILIRQPDAFYAVNRKLRELARGQRDLATGPLADWDGEDFNHSEYRALMNLFKLALEQDEFELYDFLREQAGAALALAFETLLTEDQDDLRARVKGNFLADADVFWQRNQRAVASVNVTNDLIEKALQLRTARLKRESEELAFLQLDAQANHDDAASFQFQTRIFQISQARRLIESEINRVRTEIRQ